MKKRNVIIFLFLIVGIIGLTVGISVAFFNYTRTGTSNTVSVGRINFISRQTKTISLTNIFPIDPTESNIMDDETKVGTFEIEIIGDTDYNDGVEYLISSVNSNIYTSSGKIVPISLDINATNLGESSDNYFTARKSKNATLYKKLVGDTLIGNEMLFVGYIKPNTTSGTIEGINGKITVKAYLDKNKIGVSDTYDGTESGSMGTTNEWADGRTILTTAEWNALQTNNLSFQVKVEANEGIWVNGSLEEIMRESAVLDNINSTYVNNETPGINYREISSDTNGKGIYILSTSANLPYPIMYYRGDVDNNNVFFANKCWQIVRTTDTGGVKLIYNGENTGTNESPACEPATGTDRQITLNINGTDTNTFAFSGEGMNKSPAYVGYMYGNVYNMTNEQYTEGAYFGNSFTYDEINHAYTLVDTQVGIDNYHHYTCNLTSATGTCTSIRYYFSYTVYNGIDSYCYFTLTDGKSIEDAINEMQKNTTDSNAKEKIDIWYEENILGTEYANNIEDTIYCNERLITLLGGLDPNGGDIDTAIGFFSNSAYLSRNLMCSNKNDSFTVLNEKGNKALKYPIALLTSFEITLAGGKRGNNTNETFYLYGSSAFWTMSPSYFHVYGQAYATQYIEGIFSSNKVNRAYGLRPVISLKPNIAVKKGDGTPTNPYIVIN